MSKLIIGCDEVGTGSCASSFIVCGVRAEPSWSLQGLNDSKKLSPKRREELSEKILQDKNIAFHMIEKSNIVIDSLGLGVALKQAFVELFQALNVPDCHYIVDGQLKFVDEKIKDYDITVVPKADGKYPTVMAASIIAKVHRDNQMRELHKLHPEYEWNINFGYLNPAHIAAIKKYGYTDLHRRSYKIKALQPKQLAIPGWTK